jgi:hypothetical protein
MKVKVRFFDKELLKTYFALLSAISVIAALILIFVTIPEQYKICGSIAFVIALLAIYLGLWIHANSMRRVILTINNSKAVVKIGNIFDEEGLRVIAFNEYFDTIVDERIIASSSLNGQFITNHIDDVDRLNKEICESEYLSSRKKENNPSRKYGNTCKYQLGSIHIHKDYLLTAFTKFDDNNRAFLTMADYINCLLNFWNEIDIIYANRSVVLPLLGTGITRVRGYDTMSEQEKLELLLWSFKISRIKFTYPAKVTVVIHESLQDKINFYKLRNI